MTHSASASRRAARGRPLSAVLALDLGGTHLRTAVARPDGTLVARLMTGTPRGDASTLAEACLRQLRETLAAADAVGIRPELLAISAPGPLDPASGVLIDPPNLHRSLWGFPLAPTLGSALGLRALLERDTQVAALAEGMFGAARGLTDYVYLTVSTGVGGAAVIAGRLLRGPDGVAGELGHLSVDLAGPPCGCGGRGHLEALSSGTGIAAAARGAWESGEIAPDTPLGRLIAERGADAVGGRDVDRAEADGDPLARAIMERAREAFAAAMVSIVDIFNPQRVIVGGGVAFGQADRLLGPARERVRREAFRTQAERAEIVPAGLGDDVGLLGALGLAELDDLQPGATTRAVPGLSGAGALGDHVDDKQQESSAAAVG